MPLAEPTGTSQPQLPYAPLKIWSQEVTIRGVVVGISLPHGSEELRRISFPRQGRSGSAAVGAAEEHLIDADSGALERGGVSRYRAGRCDAMCLGHELSNTARHVFQPADLKAGALAAAMA